jgi:hypothetical protein
MSGPVWLILLKPNDILKTDGQSTQWGIIGEILQQNLSHQNIAAWRGAQIQLSVNSTFLW